MAAGDIMRGTVSFVTALFLILIALLVMTNAIEPLFQIVKFDDAVQAQGWGGHAELIFTVVLDYGIWIFGAGMFLVALQLIHRRTATRQRRRQ